MIIDEISEIGRETFGHSDLALEAIIAKFVTIWWSFFVSYRRFFTFSTS